MSDSYLYIIAALLPLSAFTLVFQTNPYHALVIRGILGAVAALVYAVFGAADVALTEALVGTMLAITLYAVAVRSSLSLRLGVLEEVMARINLSPHPVPDSDQVLVNGNAEAVPPMDSWRPLLAELRRILAKRHMRLELTPYPNQQSLHQALLAKEIHATCMGLASPDSEDGNIVSTASNQTSHRLAVRVQRIYSILQSELTTPGVTLSQVSTTDGLPSDIGKLEVQAQELKGGHL